MSASCARRWVGRYREGDSDLFDRSSAPRRVANRTDPERITMIAKLRRLRMTAAEIAETLSMPLSTVSGILTRIGMGRLGRLGLEPAVRYERSRPGELVHVDVKKLGRIVGGAGKRWRNNGYQHYTGSYTDAAVGCTRRRVGSTSTSPSTTTAASPTPKCSPTRKPPPPSDSSAVPCLLPPLRHPRRGRAQRQRPRLHLDQARARLPPTPAQTPPHPALPAATNGKAERFIRTMLAGWAYARLRLKPRTHPRP